ncbi:MAG TPA: carboxypeptidase-like regulatory domain-containing protein, partial [Pyrinomonadaceae bacterium]
MKNATRLFLLFASLLMLFVVPVCGQTSGSISGEVKDEKQAVVTNATVTVRNVKTNDVRTTSTDGEGRYRFTGMPVGDYEVTVESTGFAKYVQSGISLVLNQAAT